MDRTAAGDVVTPSISLTDFNHNATAHDGDVPPAQ